MATKSVVWNTVGAAVGTALAYSLTGPLRVAFGIVAVACAIMGARAYLSEQQDDQSERQRHHVSEKGEHWKTRATIESSANELAGTIQELHATLQRIEAAGIDQAGLQRRCVSLAAEIAAFMEQRIQEFLRAPQSMTILDESYVLDDAETSRLYWQLFGGQASDLRDEISVKLGLRDPDLESAHVQPSSNVGIHKVINGFRRLAGAIERHGQHSSVEQEWLPEVEEFSRHAGVLWPTLRRRYQDMGFYGMGAGDVLNDLVADAGWPKDRGLPDGERGIFQAWLFDFVERLYRSDVSAFDGSLSGMAKLVKRWHVRLGGPHGAVFAVWLPDNLGYLHIHSLTLMRYLEEARAPRTHNPAPDYRPLEALRDLYRESTSATEPGSVDLQ